MKFGQIVGCVAGFLWSVFRILWVCRVSALSALGGGVLIGKVEQAHDLFADTGLSWYHWLAFFVFLFLWAWLVHGMARRALQFDEWVPEAHKPDSIGLNDAERKELRKPFYGLAVWIPRLLGACVFIATGWALCLTWRNLEPAIGLDQAEAAVSQIKWLLFFTALTGLGYLGFVVVWRGLRARLTSREMEEPLLIGEPSLLLAACRAALHPWKDGAAFWKVLDNWLNRALFVLAFAVTALFVIAIFEPNFISDLLPRVLFLPVLLGGFVLLLGEIAALSHRYSTPLLVCFFVIGGILGFWLKYYNDVRWIAPLASQSSSASPASTVNGPRHELGLAEAIQRWKADNCKPGNDCPRPIVIAGAGGASRAGFFTASVVGAMIDAGVDNKDIGDIRSRIFALSTVSGSSVGAVMMRAAWMDALANKSLGTPPCKDSGTTAWFRDAATPDKAGAKPTVSWRDCFQKLLAGDFLSPIFVGLTYRDLFPLGNPVSRKGFGEDRSGLLEQSFERWYREMTGAKIKACGPGETTGLCRRIGHLPDRPNPQAAGDWIPLLFVNGTSVATGRRIIVSDVRVGCILDGKRRFLELAYDYRELRDPTVRRDHDQCSDTVSDPTGQDIDMRLSTVAMMSARFPLVSTQGVIRDVNGKIVDSVVDGGYFENDGLATAADIVRELQISGLHPIAIRIVNEPDEKIGGDRKLGGSANQNPEDLASQGLISRDGENELIRPPLPKAEERTLFDVYTSIGRALYATRSGHEEGHLAYLRETLQGPLVRIGVDEIILPNPSEPSKLVPPQPSQVAKDLFCRTPVKKDTAMHFVSMSWWMSQPVQAYLDAQFCRSQIDRLICVLKLKGKESGDNSCG